MGGIPGRFAVGVAGLALCVACGGGGGTTDVETSPSAVEASAIPSETEEALSEVTFEATTGSSASTPLGFDPSVVRVAAGEATLTLSNPTDLPHTLVIEDVAGFKLETEAGAEDQAVVELEPGTYRFFCDVEGHSSAGMRGTIEVV